MGIRVERHTCLYVKINHKISKIYIIFLFYNCARTRKAVPLHPQIVRKRGQTTGERGRPDECLNNTIRPQH